jgi:hypothetical protein
MMRKRFFLLSAVALLPSAGLAQLLPEPMPSGLGLSSNGSKLSVIYGTTAGTAAQGNDSRIVNAASTSSVTSAVAGEATRAEGAESTLTTAAAAAQSTANGAGSAASAAQSTANSASTAAAAAQTTANAALPASGGTLTGTIRGGTLSGTNVSAADVTAAGGATAYSPAAKGGHQLNAIDDFGATGNGTTDDTTALQAAFTASASQVVTLPCGVYKTTAPLNVPASGVVRGSTNYAWYYSYGDGPVPASSIKPCVRITPSGSGSWSGATGVINLGGWTHIEDIGIDGGAISTIPLIYDNMPFDEIVHIWTNGGLNSISAAYNASLIAQGLRVRFSNLTNAHSDCLSLMVSADFDVTGNDINGCAGYAINDQTGPGIIANNILQDSSAGGLRLAGIVQGVTVVGNRFDGNYYDGMYFSGFTGNVSVVGNIFRTDGTDGGVQSAHLLFAQNANTGLLTFSGNTYVTNGTYPNYIAAVLQGGTVGPFAFYDKLPAQKLGVFAPTASAALSSLTWSSGTITATTSAAHGMGTSGQVEVTISGAVPSGYNGTSWCTMTGTNTFTCPLATNPGTETAPGTYIAQFTQAVLQPLWLPAPGDMPGPYANDAAAATAGVPVGAVYEDTSGITRKRIN